MLAVLADCLAAFFANLGHMLAVLAYRLAALAARFSGLLWRELVGSALLVSRFASLAGNLTLFFIVHRCKSAIARIAHETLLFLYFATEPCRQGPSSAPSRFTT